MFRERSTLSTWLTVNLTEVTSNGSESHYCVGAQNHFNVKRYDAMLFLYSNNIAPLFLCVQESLFKSICFGGNNLYPNEQKFLSEGFKDEGEGRRPSLMAFGGAQQYSKIHESY